MNVNQFKALRESILLSTKNRGGSPSVNEVEVMSAQACAAEISAQQLVALMGGDSIGEQKVGLSLCIRKPSQQLREAIIKSCKSENWEVREYAGEALASILMCQQGTLGEELRRLARDEDQNIRRAAAIAARIMLKDAKTRKIAHSVLLELASDTNGYVEDAVSPFSLGDQLFRVDKKLAIATLKKLSASENEQERRSAARAIQSAESRIHASEWQPLVPKLIKDKSKRVSAQAGRAIILLIRNNPEVKIIPEIMQCIDKLPVRQQAEIRARI